MGERCEGCGGIIYGEHICRDDAETIACLLVPAETLERLRAQLAEAREKMLEIEWSGKVGVYCQDLLDACPVCDWVKPEHRVRNSAGSIEDYRTKPGDGKHFDDPPHAPDCWLEATKP